MSSYRVEISKSAEKSLRKLRGDQLYRVAATIKALEKEPRPDGCRKLLGYDRTYRVRVGKHRIIYDVYDRRVVVVVLKIGHRRDVYR